MTGGNVLVSQSVSLMFTQNSQHMMYIIHVMTAESFRCRTQILVSMRSSWSPSFGKITASLLMTPTLCLITHWTQNFSTNSGLQETKLMWDMWKRADRTQDWSSTRQASDWPESLRETWLLMFLFQSNRKSPAQWISRGFPLTRKSAILKCGLTAHRRASSTPNLTKRDQGPRDRTRNWAMTSLSKICLITWRRI